MANTPKKSTAKKAAKSNVTKCPPAKARGIKTTAEVPRPKRKTITKKATTKKPARKAERTLSDSDVVVFRAKPVLASRQKLVSLIPKNGISVSALVKKAIKAEINPRGETTAEYVRKHIEGSFRARKIALKE